MNEGMVIHYDCGASLSIAQDLGMGCFMLRFKNCQCDECRKREGTLKVSLNESVDMVGKKDVTFNDILGDPASAKVVLPSKDGVVKVLMDKSDKILSSAQEDLDDVQAAKDAIEDMEAKGETPIPLEEVKKRAGRWLGPMPE